MPTASAVVSDVVDVALGRTTSTFADVSGAGTRVKIRAISDINSQYYLRFRALDRPGTLARIAGVLGDHGISILSVMQKEVTEDADYVPVVILTHEACEGDLSAAIEKIDGLDVVEGPSVCIRIEK
jgi:homoserine dehydrogenase